MNLQELREPAEAAEYSCGQSLSEVQARISSIDWSFVDRQRAPAIEAIHPYPAKFIGDIPRALLGALPLPPKTLVFDPFAGSGTTLLEAQRRGLESVGVGLNPIACLIARVKTARTPPGLLEKALQIRNTGLRPVRMVPFFGNRRWSYNASR